MSQKNDTSISGTAWLFLLILAINSCRMDAKVQRLVDAAERVSPRTVEP